MSHRHYQPPHPPKPTHHIITTPTTKPSLPNSTDSLPCPCDVSQVYWFVTYNSGPGLEPSEKDPAGLLDR